MSALHIDLLDEEYAIWKLPPGAEAPSFPAQGVLSITRTPDELSGVSLARLVPPGARIEAGFRCLRVKGPLAFELTGILASIASPLAAAGVSIFALSTYDTDYVLVPAKHLADAARALESAGHVMTDSAP